MRKEPSDGFVPSLKAPIANVFQMLLTVNSLAVDVAQRHLNAEHVDLSLHTSNMIEFLP